MPREKWPYGRTVENGVLRYVSPSGLMLADAARGDGGCLRKWYYQVQLGIKSPPTKAQEIGTQLHAEVEHFLKTGERVLGALASTGQHMIPVPGPDLVGPPVIGGRLVGGIELDIASTRGVLEDAPLRIAGGIPVVGYIDLIHARGTNRGTPDITDTLDPSNTIETIDWKTTSATKWIKSPNAMASTLQMTTYGKWAYTVDPRIEHIRLSHGYFITQGAGQARKVTLRVDQAFVERNWEHAEGVARLMVHAAAATNPNQVDANTRSCDAFGGCPAKSVCSAGMQSSLASLIGQTAAASVLGKKESMPKLLDRILAKQNVAPQAPTYASAIVQAYGSPPGQPAPQVTLVAGPPPDARTVNPGQPVTYAPPSAAEIAKLRAEERAMILSRLPQGFAEAVARVETFGLGMPRLTAGAAQAYAVLKDLPPANEFAGTGGLANANNGQGLNDPGQMVMVADELAKLPPAPQAMGILPQDTPASDPVLAAEPIPGQVFPVATPPPPPASAPAPSPIAAVVAQADRAPRKRRTKAEMEAAKAAEVSVETHQVTPGVMAPLVTAAPTIAQAPATAPAPVTDSIDTSQVFVYVGCHPSCDFEPLSPVIDAICDDLAQSQGLDDIRIADQGPLAFGKWRAVLGAALREQDIPGGHYVLDMVGDVADVAAETLRKICAQRGGVFVR